MFAHATQPPKQQPLFTLIIAGESDPGSWKKVNAIKSCIHWQNHDKKSGAQWLSGSVLDSRPKGRWFEPHRHHCLVVLEQDTFILAQYWFNLGRPFPV